MNRLLSVKEVAAILGVSYRTALVFIRKNEKSLAIKIGRQYRVSEAALARLIENPTD